MYGSGRKKKKKTQKQIKKPRDFARTLGGLDAAEALTKRAGKAGDGINVAGKSILSDAHARAHETPTARSYGKPSVGSQRKTTRLPVV